MIRQLVHKLKLHFGKKIKVASPHIIDGVAHVTDKTLNSCWGSVTLQEQRRYDYKETH